MSSYLCSNYDAESNHFIFNQHFLEKSHKGKRMRMKKANMQSEQKKDRIDQITSNRELRINRLSKDLILHLSQHNRNI